MKHVIKFGGTCFGNKRKYKWISETIKNNYLSKNIQPILVVSAISKDSKDSGTTTNLINLLHTKNKDYFNRIKDDHLNLIDDLGLTKDNSLNKKMTSNFYEITAFSEITDYYPNAILEENIIKIGERMSSQILHSYFINNNINNKLINLEHIISPSTINTPEDIYNENIIRNIKSKFIYSHIKNADSVIMGGYMGAWGYYGGILNILDRGYSDYTGAIVSSAIEADKFEVYKESSAIFTLNPVKYKDSKVVEQMTFDDLILLTHCGNEALNKYATHILKKDNIPITIRNAFSDKIVKTEIYNFKNHEGVVALTDKNCCVVTINTSDSIKNLKIIAEKYNMLAYTYNYGKLSIVIENFVEGDLDFVGTVHVDKKFISIIGNFITNKVGFARDIFNVIADLNVNLDDIIQTHNQNHMSFVIDSENATKTMETLNKKLF